jgi:hypothetical protein
MAIALPLLPVAAPKELAASSWKQKGGKTALLPNIAPVLARFDRAAALFFAQNGIVARCSDLSEAGD